MPLRVLRIDQQFLAPSVDGVSTASRVMLLIGGDVRLQLLTLGQRTQRTDLGRSRDLRPAKRA
jgi:hypothetical protein